MSVVFGVLSVMCSLLVVFWPCLVCWVFFFMLVLLYCSLWRLICFLVLVLFCVCCFLLGGVIVTLRLCDLRFLFLFSVVCILCWFFLFVIFLGGFLSFCALLIFMCVLCAFVFGDFWFFCL